MSLINVPVANIDTAGRALEADLPVAWLDQQLEDPDNELKSASEGHVSARLSRSGTDVVVRGRVKASIRTACARCLEPTTVDVDTELALLLKAAPGQAAAAPGEGRHGEARRSHAAVKARGEAAAGTGKARGEAAAGTGKPGQTAKKPAKESKEPPEYEFSSEEADFDTYDGETVVLDSFVREAILLEMPIFPLCSESCPGIRPSPEAGDGGDTRPVDPRLAPLGALRAGLEKAMSQSKGSTAPADDEGASSGTAGAPAQKKTTKKE